MRTHSIVSIALLAAAASQFGMTSSGQEMDIDTAGRGASLDFRRVEVPAQQPATRKPEG